MQEDFFAGPGRRGPDPGRRGQPLLDAHFGPRVVETRRTRKLFAVKRPGHAILPKSGYPGGDMVVSRWGNRLGVRLPRALVDRGLKPGDELEVVAVTPMRIEVENDPRRARAVDRMRARGLRIPEGYAFDRDEANA